MFWCVAPNRSIHALRPLPGCFSGVCLLRAVPGDASDRFQALANGYGDPKLVDQWDAFMDSTAFDGPRYAQLLDDIVQQHDSSAGEDIKDLLQAVRQHSSILDDCQDEMLILDWFKELHAAFEMVSPVA